MLCVTMFVIFFLFFFFQAEDGIRDHCVTGVQTCALPICGSPQAASAAETSRTRRSTRAPATSEADDRCAGGRAPAQIGRASCRERVWISVVVETLKKKDDRVEECNDNSDELRAD